MSRRPASTSRRAAPSPRVRALLLLAALAVLALGLSPGPVRAQDAAAAARPLLPPAPLERLHAEPDRGVRFGLGVPYALVEADFLDDTLRGGRGAATGVAVHLEAALGPWRVGYVRELYRRALPAGTTRDGAPVDFLSADADQVWGFYGVRPAFPLYLAAGLGWQHRLVRVLDGETVRARERDTGLVAGLLADWDLALPFSLQLRYVQDVGGDVLRRRALALHLSYYAPF